MRRLRGRGVQLIHFLHPSCDALVSGGNKFNRRILARARAHGWPLQSLVIDPDAPGAWDIDQALQEPAARGAASVVSWAIWDSLLLRRYPLSEPMFTRRRDAFLLHYLPSLDPQLNPERRLSSRLLEDRVIGRAAFLVATGRNFADALRTRYPAVRTYLCEPGVDQVFLDVRRSVLPRNGDAAVHLLSVGNLVPGKGYLELLTVLEQLNKPNWVWHIAGSIEADRAFTRLFFKRAAQWLTRQRILLHGTLASSALAVLMSRMDVFVAASHYESYGMALAEAVAAGLPVVATEVGEAVRVVGEPRQSCLVKVGAWDEFADVLSSTIAGLAGRPAAMAHAPAIAVRTWDAVFSDFRMACETGMEHSGP